MVYRSGGQKLVFVSSLLKLSVISDVVHSGKKYEGEEGTILTEVKHSPFYGFPDKWL